MFSHCPWTSLINQYLRIRLFIRVSQLLSRLMPSHSLTSPKPWKLTSSRVTASFSKATVLNQSNKMIRYLTLMKRIRTKLKVREQSQGQSYSKQMLSWRKSWDRSLAKTSGTNSRQSMARDTHLGLQRGSRGLLKLSSSRRLVLRCTNSSSRFSCAWSWALGKPRKFGKSVKSLLIWNSMLASRASSDPSQISIAFHAFSNIRPSKPCGISLDLKLGFQSKWDLYRPKIDRSSISTLKRSRSPLVNSKFSLSEHC